MSNLEKYNEAFVSSFSIEKSALNPEFAYQSIPAWDSVGHMALIAAIEESFEIMIEIDDIIEFSSYGKGIEILSKYGVAI
jgi:acyl carrier protein